MAELYQVEFKGSRREYYYNSYHHSLKLGEHVIVQLEQGEDIGLLTKKIDLPPERVTTSRPRSILRPAGSDDEQRLAELRAKEEQYRREVRPLIRKHGLIMKIVDVECQYDGNKITFYFTADHRVDFRALVRDLASRYRTRIELRQIGVRDEARRLDGYGICGLRQCCNGPVTEFATISTQYAREQDLSLNPSKISGNCGRLLCCLRYEVDLYRQVKAKFPPVGARVKTKSGRGVIERIDIFSEKAIVRGEEGIPFRVAEEDILAVNGVARRSAAAQPQEALDVPLDASDEAVLKELDESESSDNPN